MIRTCLAALLVVTFASSVWGQLDPNRTLGGGGSSLSRNQGLQQTGQLTSDAAIARDPTAFVGGSAGNFLSRGGTTANTGLNTSAFRTLGTLGRNTFGLGGFGGGFGRFGNQNLNRNMALPKVSSTIYWWSV